MFEWAGSFPHMHIQLDNRLVSIMAILHIGGRIVAPLQKEFYGAKTSSTGSCKLVLSVFVAIKGQITLAKGRTITCRRCDM